MKLAEHLRAAEGDPVAVAKLREARACGVRLHFALMGIYRDQLLAGYAVRNVEDLKGLVMAFENTVFVFGSNLAGRHGKGAALYAAQRHGAAAGVGKGTTGSSYALPTKDTNLNTLAHAAVQQHVNDFITHAMRNPRTQFMVSAVGTGLAGYTAEQIAPMFRAAITLENVYLPEAFLNALGIPASAPARRMSFAVDQRFT